MPVETVVVLVDLPDATVRAVRQRLSADALPAFRELHLDGSRGTPYLVLHSPVLPGAALDVEAVSPCAPTEPGAEDRAGGRFAATTVRGDAAVQDAHRAVREHALAHGLTVTGPPRERHLADGRVQVAWPVEEPETGG